MSKKGLHRGKKTRQQAKMLLKFGKELDDIMMGSVIEKVRKGGDARRVVKDVESGIESYQAYKLGGGTHNTYSGKKKSKKKKR